MAKGAHINIIYVMVIMHGDMTHIVWHADFGSFVTGTCTGHCYLEGHRYKLALTNDPLAKMNSIKYSV